MLFNSAAFLIFFPIVALVYFVIPDKVKYIWLLVSSYYFYMCWNAKYAVLILFSTAVTYVCSLIIQKINDRSAADKTAEKATVRKKVVLAVCLILNLGLLFLFKYLGYTSDLITSVLHLIGIDMSIPTFDLLLPVGISFYTFQAIGYTIDVHRGDTEAEHNFLRYALFVSFFPQLVAGPIERSGNLLSQLAVPHKFDYERMVDGLLMALWGYFLKLVIADRIAIFVDTVYGDHSAYPGTYLIVASILFAIQIYCDFAGYSTIAIGTARILGVNLMENFDAPYLAVTVSEFWRRWHISLTSWFKDYLYIPLGGNRKGKIKKFINKMIVFLVSGAWHGAGLTYIIWGGLNGAYQVIGELLMPIRNSVVKKCKINRSSLLYRIIEGVITFILVDLAWVFFRANTTGDAVSIIRSMLSTRNLHVLVDGSLYECGLDIKNFILLIICMIALLIADIFKIKKISIRGRIEASNMWIRGAIVALAVVFILVFGIWGTGYTEKSFIYFQF